MVTQEHYWATLDFDPREVSSVPELTYRRPTDLGRIIRKAVATVATDKRLDNEDYGRIVRIFLKADHGNSDDFNNLLYINATLFPTEAGCPKAKIKTLYTGASQTLDSSTSEHIPLDTVEEFFKGVRLGYSLDVGLSLVEPEDVFWMMASLSQYQNHENVHIRFSEDLERDVKFLEAIGIRHMSHDNGIVINPCQPNLTLNHTNAVRAYDIAKSTGLGFKVSYRGARQERRLEEKMADGRLVRSQGILVRSELSGLNHFKVFGHEVSGVMRAHRDVFGWDFSGCPFSITYFDVEDRKRFEEAKERDYIISL